MFSFSFFVYYEKTSAFTFSCDSTGMLFLPFVFVFHQRIEQFHVEKFPGDLAAAVKIFFLFSLNDLTSGI